MKMRQIRLESNKSDTPVESILDQMTQLVQLFDIDHYEVGDFRQVRFVLSLAIFLAI